MLKLSYKEDSKIECGVDEAGRGCLWGPLYSAAVVLPVKTDWDPEFEAIVPQIKDSKKISKKKREKIYELILKHAKSIGVGIVTSQEIDTMGMTKANKTAFERAISNLSVEVDRILIDGCLHIETSKELIVEPNLDNIYLNVAAGSIIAKVSRDKYVEEYVSKDISLQEKYDLMNNKGYGTLKHRQGIIKYSKHTLHRNLFLRKLLGSNCSIIDDE
jgi:ribonuclease HII